MSDKTDRRNSDLFLLRLWAGEKDEANAELDIIDVLDSKGRWHGRLLHVYSGEATSFDDWESLRQALEGEFLRSQMQEASESLQVNNE